MDKAVEMKISGLKCDAEGCNYMNTEVPVDEYDSWLNRPCPLCGASLLTEEDLAATKLLMQIAELTNKIFPASKNEPMYQGTFNMNGSGFEGMEVTIQPLDDQKEKARNNNDNNRK